MKGGIPRQWLLLDTCSTDKVLNNCSMLGNIVPCDVNDDFNMEINGGSMVYCLKSTLKHFPLKVYYNEESVGNIISFLYLVKFPGVFITLDSRVNYGFNVTYLGQLYHFLPYENGLYNYDKFIGPRSVSD